MLATVALFLLTLPPVIAPWPASAPAEVIGFRIAQFSWFPFADGDRISLRVESPKKQEQLGVPDAGASVVAGGRYGGQSRLYWALCETPCTIYGRPGTTDFYFRDDNARGFTKLTLPQPLRKSSTIELWTRDALQAAAAAHDPELDLTRADVQIALQNIRESKTATAKWEKDYQAVTDALEQQKKRAHIKIAVGAPLYGVGLGQLIAGVLLAAIPQCSKNCANVYVGVPLAVVGGIAGVTGGILAFGSITDTILPSKAIAARFTELSQHPPPGAASEYVFPHEE